MATLRPLQPGLQPSGMTMRDAVRQPAGTVNPLKSAPLAGELSWKNNLLGEVTSGQVEQWNGMTGRMPQAFTNALLAKGTDGDGVNGGLAVGEVNTSGRVSNSGDLFAPFPIHEDGLRYSGWRRPDGRVRVEVAKHVEGLKDGQLVDLTDPASDELADTFVDWINTVETAGILDEIANELTAMDAMRPRHESPRPGESRLSELKIVARVVADYDTLDAEIIQDLGEEKGAREVAQMKKERALGRYSNGWTYKIDGVVKIKFLAFSLARVMAGFKELAKSGRGPSTPFLLDLFGWIETLIHEFAHAELEAAELGEKKPTGLDEAGHGPAFEKIERKLRTKYSEAPFVR